MLELRQQLKTASVSNKGGEKESDRLKKELDKARSDTVTCMPAMWVYTTNNVNLHHVVQSFLLFSVSSPPLLHQQVHKHMLLSHCAIAMWMCLHSIMFMPAAQLALHDLGQQCICTVWQLYACLHSVPDATSVVCSMHLLHMLCVHVQSLAATKHWQYLCDHVKS